jgi:dihydrofolate reductase
MGRRTFDVGVGPWGDNPTFHAPCFVVAHHPHEPVIREGGTTYSFVTDGIESALERARAAAGDKDVIVMGGASIAQQCIKARLLDEIRLHLVPLLLGEGTRLFDRLGTDPIELETTQVIDAPGVTHFRFRAR